LLLRALIAAGRGREGLEEDLYLGVIEGETEDKDLCLEEGVIDRLSKEFSRESATTLLMLGRVAAKRGEEEGLTALELENWWKGGLAEPLIRPVANISRLVGIEAGPLRTKE
jgi:hypothetical protein